MEVDYNPSDELSLALSYSFKNKVDGDAFYEFDLSYTPVSQKNQLGFLLGVGKGSFATARIDVRF